MTRAMYLRILEECLQGLPPARKAEVLEDVETYFREGTQEGHSEEDLAERLGPPEVLAGEYGAQPAAESGRSQEAPRFLDALRGFLSDVTRAPMDRREPYAAQWSFSIAPEQSVEIAVSGVDVQMDVHESSLMTVDFQGERSRHPDGSCPEITAWQEGGGVFIRQEDGASDNAGLRSLISGSVLRGRLTIRLPRLTLDRLSVQTASGDQEIANMDARQMTLSAKSGDLNVRSLVCQERLTLESRSGDLEMDKLLAHELAVQTASGDVALQDAHASDVSADSRSGDVTLKDLRCVRLRAATSSGDMEAERIHVEQDAHISTTSGDCDLRDLNVVGKTVFRSSSGDVEGVRLAFGPLEVSTSSGEVDLSQIRAREASIHTASGNCALECLDFDSIQATTASGTIELRLPLDTGFTYAASTSSGTISVRFPTKVLEAQDRSQRSGTVGDGTRQVSMKSASGAIFIRPIRT